MGEEKRIESKSPSIRATVRRSEKDPGRDAWLTMEVSAERSVTNYDPNQDILDVGDLAQELDMELRKVISDSYERLKEERDDNREIGVCAEHGEEYKRYEKEGDIWWSHQLDSGKWCKKKD
tara:strand:- start:2212 stop:2574 length:363 start_codon:yes stop_codon:yes gene_type:complete